ncbi:MAG: DUF2089 domain-containing protein [Chloroflexi bacterium]|nr:DUF2089 domain-containing protein [Chloroflexota bacterium]
MRKLIEACPACEGDLIVTRLTCVQCGTEVHGSFQPNVFSHLEPHDLDFVIQFVKAKGNIKEMERALDTSYWSIRKKLDDIVAFLDTQTLHEDERQQAREAILHRLREGELNIDEAEALLRQLRS